MQHQTAIDRELTKDQANGLSQQSFDRQSFERVVARRAELFGGKPLPEDSAVLIREARETRDAETEKWACAGLESSLPPGSRERRCL